MLAEGEFHGARLDPVVEFRGGAVIVDVLHVARRDAALFETDADGPRRLFAALFQTHPVIGLAGGAIAGDLAVYVRAARLGPLHLFHHEEPRTLGENEAVAILGEGPRGACGLFVPTGGHDAHQLEAAQDQGRDGRIHAVRHNGIQDAHLNVVLLPKWWPPGQRRVRIRWSYKTIRPLLLTGSSEDLVPVLGIDKLDQVPGVRSRNDHLGRSNSEGKNLRCYQDIDGARLRLAGRAPRL